MATTLAAHVLRGSPCTRMAQGGTFILILQMGKQAEGYTAIKWYVGISNLCLGLIYNSKQNGWLLPSHPRERAGCKALWKAGLEDSPVGRGLPATSTHTYAPDNHFTANRHQLPNREGGALGAERGPGLPPPPHPSHSGQVHQVKMPRLSES